VHQHRAVDADRGGQRAAGVHHEQVAGAEQAGQFSEDMVADRVATALFGSAAADQQPDRVPGHAPVLGGLVRLQFRGQREVQDGGHDSSS
jgi:hypothetical protein